MKVMHIKASEYLQYLQNLDIHDLNKIQGIGEKLIQNLQEFTNSHRYSNLIHKFKLNETNNNILKIDITSKIETQSLKLHNYNICITGTFDISRDNIKEKLEKLGAKISNQVSKKTTLLLAGLEPGKKIDEAEKLGVTIMYNLDIINGT
jgi:DNA ligase (NAD+)